ERWMLAVRFAGSAALVSAEETALRAATGGRFTALRADEAHALWMRAAESFATRPVTFRVGGLPDSSDELMDLLQHQVGDEWISASPGVGAIRWGGETSVDRLRRLRRTLAGLAPADPGVALHLDRCLGCRGCEPVCPSGVAYGRGLEAARALLTERRGVPPLVRAALGTLTGTGEGSRVLYALARLLRATGI